MITILVMASILTVALSLGSVVINGLKASNTQANATKAYFAAESGAERILWEVRKNDFDPATTTPVICIDGQYFLNDFSACGNNIDATTITNQSNNSLFYILYGVDMATTTLTGFGEFAGTRRAIQLQY